MDFKLFYIYLTLLFFVACSPEPQQCGMLLIQNNTANTIIVESNIVCFDPHYPLKFELLQGDTKVIACSRAKKQTSGKSIPIEEIIDNYAEAEVRMTSIVNGVETSKTWTYASRNDSDCELFNLDHCTVDFGEDSRKNFTTIYYTFKVSNLTATNANFLN